MILSKILFFKAYKNFGDKVATLKRKLDCLIRDLPETTSSSHKIKSVSPGLFVICSITRINAIIEFYVGNTPPDYRQTDMELSDSDESLLNLKRFPFFY